MQRHLLVLSAILTLSCNGLAQGQGSWQIPADELEGNGPSHAIVLPPTTIGGQYYADGLVLYFRETFADGAYLWDPLDRDTLLERTPDPGVNQACAGHAFDDRGRVVFSGGHKPGTNRCGITLGTLYNPLGNSGVDSFFMEEARWYPTCITDADGRVWIFSGITNERDPGNPTDCSVLNNSVESYRLDDSPHLRMRLAELFAFPASPDLVYLMMHLLSGNTSRGNMVIVGPGVTSYWFDSTSPAPAVPGPDMKLGQDRGASSSVLLPIDLRDAVPDERVLIIGGAPDGEFPPTPTCEILANDGVQAKWTWDFTSKLKKARGHADAVLLADGNVFVIGGGQGNGAASNPRYGCPILKPEIFDVGSEQWALVAPHVYPRMYHSVAVLLADGSVWTAGQNKNSFCNSSDPPRTWPEGGKIVEIYYPWYFDETRPVITSAPQPHPNSALPRGETFTVGYTLPPGTGFGHVAIRSLDSVTHSVNMSQRYVILRNEPPLNGVVEVYVPPAVYAPAGPYMLFVVDDTTDPVGVPSEATFIYLAQEE